MVTLCRLDVCSTFMREYDQIQIYYTSQYEELNDVLNGYTLYFNSALDALSKIRYCAFLSMFAYLCILSSVCSTFMREYDQIQIYYTSQYEELNDVLNGYTLYFNSALDALSKIRYCASMFAYLCILSSVCSTFMREYDQIQIYYTSQYEELNDVLNGYTLYFNSALDALSKIRYCAFLSMFAYLCEYDQIQIYYTSQYEELNDVLNGYTLYFNSALDALSKIRYCAFLSMFAYLCLLSSVCSTFMGEYDQIQIYYTSQYEELNDVLNGYTLYFNSLSKIRY